MKQDNAPHDYTQLMRECMRERADDDMNRNPSRGQRKNIKFSRPAAMCCWPLLCGETEFVLFHRRQDAQIM